MQRPLGKHLPSESFPFAQTPRSSHFIPLIFAAFDWSHPKAIALGSRYATFSGARAEIQYTIHEERLTVQQHSRRDFFISESEQERILDRVRERFPEGMLDQFTNDICGSNTEAQSYSALLQPLCFAAMRRTDHPVVPILRTRFPNFDKAAQELARVVQIEQLSVEKHSKFYVSDSQITVIRVLLSQGQLRETQLLLTSWLQRDAHNQSVPSADDISLRLNSSLDHAPLSEPPLPLAALYLAYVSVALLFIARPCLWVGRIVQPSSDYQSTNNSTNHTNTTSTSTHFNSVFSHSTFEWALAEIIVLAIATTLALLLNLCYLNASHRATRQHGLLYTQLAVTLVFILDVFAIYTASNKGKATLTVLYDLLFYACTLLLVKPRQMPLHFQRSLAIVVSLSSSLVVAFHLLFSAQEQGVQIQDYCRSVLSIVLSIECWRITFPHDREDLEAKNDGSFLPRLPFGVIRWTLGLLVLGSAFVRVITGGNDPPEELFSPDCWDSVSVFYTSNPVYDWGISCFLTIACVGYTFVLWRYKADINTAYGWHSVIALGLPCYAMLIIEMLWLKSKPNKCPSGPIVSTLFNDFTMFALLILLSCYDDVKSKADGEQREDSYACNVLLSAFVLLVGGAESALQLKYIHDFTNDHVIHAALRTVLWVEMFHHVREGCKFPNRMPVTPRPTPTAVGTLLWQSWRAIRDDDPESSSRLGYGAIGTDTLSHRTLQAEPELRPEPPTRLPGHVLRYALITALLTASAVGEVGHTAYDPKYKAAFNSKPEASGLYFVIGETVFLFFICVCIFFNERALKEEPRKFGTVAPAVFLLCCLVVLDLCLGLFQARDEGNEHIPLHLFGLLNDLFFYTSVIQFARVDDAKVLVHLAGAQSFVSAGYIGQNVYDLFHTETDFGWALLRIICSTILIIECVGMAGARPSSDRGTVKDDCIATPTDFCNFTAFYVRRWYFCIFFFVVSIVGGTCRLFSIVSMTFPTNPQTVAEQCAVNMHFEEAEPRHSMLLFQILTALVGFVLYGLSLLHHHNQEGGSLIVNPLPPENPKFSWQSMFTSGITCQAVIILDFLWAASLAAECHVSGVVPGVLELLYDATKFGLLFLLIVFEVAAVTSPIELRDRVASHTVVVALVVTWNGLDLLVNVVFMCVGRQENTWPFLRGGLLIILWPFIVRLTYEGGKYTPKMNTPDEKTSFSSQRSLRSLKPFTYVAITPLSSFPPSQRDEPTSYESAKNSSMVFQQTPRQLSCNESWH